MDQQELIERCQKQDRAAQKQLYDRYGPMLFGICRRYVRHIQDAEDVFIEGMFKILSKISSYSGKGSFEGWMKRIIVNESLMHLRKKNNLGMTRDISNVRIKTQPKIESMMHEKEILGLLDNLPPGYRTVFNLYVIEGYKHREIAELLGISINTSKSQLILAKKRMQELIERNFNYEAS